MTPIESPEVYADPYLDPVELLLCLSSPLYIAHPFAPSLNASSTLTSGLHTPIFRREPFVI